MNKFSWYDAKSVVDAAKQVNATVSEELSNPTGDAAVFKAGGIDLFDLVKEGLIEPKKIVNILDIPGLDQIQSDLNGLRIGANVTLAEIEQNPAIRNSYQAIHEAVSSAGTPQLRNMATLGGNLAQRTRCWYFRSPDHKCLRKGGSSCFARNGENENHAILNNGTCVSIHASSVATALMALDASVIITDSSENQKEVPLGEFFVSPGEDSSRETILESDELITAVIVPALGPQTRSKYIKQGSRESHDWSMADVAVVVDMTGGKCVDARVVLGAAAPTPLRVRRAERALVGNTVDKDTALAAAKAAMERALPLSQNAFKIPLFESIITQAILEIA